LLCLFPAMNPQEGDERDLQVYFAVEIAARSGPNFKVLVTASTDRNDKPSPLRQLIEQGLWGTWSCGCHQDPIERSGFLPAE
jgi:hypothetical protein